MARVAEAAAKQPVAATPEERPRHVAAVCLKLVEAHHRLATTAKVGKVGCRKHHALACDRLEQVDDFLDIVLTQVLKKLARQDRVPLTLQRRRQFLLPHAPVIPVPRAELDVRRIGVETIHDGRHLQTCLPEVGVDEHAPTSVATADIEHRLATDEWEHDRVEI
jgi:hypothetical protein